MSPLEPFHVSSWRTIHRIDRWRSSATLGSNVWYGAGFTRRGAERDALRRAKADLKQRERDEEQRLRGQRELRRRDVDR